MNHANMSPLSYWIWVMRHDAKGRVAQRLRATMRRIESKHGWRPQRTFAWVASGKGDVDDGDGKIDATHQHLRGMTGSNADSLLDDEGDDNANARVDPLLHLRVDFFGAFSSIIATMSLPDLKDASLLTGPFRAYFVNDELERVRKLLRNLGFGPGEHGNVDGVDGVDGVHRRTIDEIRQTLAETGITGDQWERWYRVFDVPLFHWFSAMLKDEDDDDEWLSTIVGMPGIVSLLRLLQPSTVAEGQLIVTWICKNGDATLLHWVLAWVSPNGERVDPAADDNLAIQWASMEGKVDVVRLLLADARVDPAAQDNAAAKAATRNGHMEVMRLLNNANRTRRRRKRSRAQAGLNRAYD
jgi:hypothetical protein